MRRAKKVRHYDDGPWHLVTATRLPPSVGDFEQVAVRRDATRHEFVQVIDELGNEGYLSLANARRYLTYERHESGARVVVSDAALRAMVLERQEEVDEMARMGHVWSLDVPGALALNRRATEAHARAMGERPMDAQKARVAATLERIKAGRQGKSDTAIARQIREAAARGDMDAAHQLVDELGDELMREMARMHLADAQG